MCSLLYSYFICGTFICAPYSELPFTYVNSVVEAKRITCISKYYFTNERIQPHLPKEKNKEKNK